MSSTQECRFLSSDLDVLHLITSLTRPTTPYLQASIHRHSPCETKSPLATKQLFNHLRDCSPNMHTMPHTELDIIDRKLTNLVLSNEGYPLLHEWSNKTVKTVFGRCSRQDHMLQVLVLNHDWGIDWLRQWRRSETDTQGCLAFDNSTGWKYVTTLCGDCSRCGKNIKSRIVSWWLIAIYRRPVVEMWKGVLTRKRYPGKYVFEGSARCNLFGHPKHCMTPSHLVLETFMHNMKRKSHHSGAQRCNCVQACIGESVRPQSNYIRFPKPEPKKVVGTLIQPQAQTALNSPKRAGSSVSRHRLSQQS